MLLGLSLVILVIISTVNMVLGTPFGSNQFATVGVDGFTGVTTIIVVISGLAAITGIQVLGSGLSPESVKVLILMAIYITIWASFTVLSYNLIVSIEIFGAMIYILITIMYAVGVMQKVSGSN